MYSGYSPTAMDWEPTPTTTRYDIKRIKSIYIYRLFIKD